MKTLSQRNSLLVAVSVFLLLRSRIISLPKDVLFGLRAVANGKQPPSPEELLKALQELFVKGENGHKSILVPHKNGISKVPIRPTPDRVLDANAQHFPPPPVSSKPNLDKSFLRQLKAILLYVAFPKLRSKQVATLLFHSFFLVLRTVLSVWVARLDGCIVRDLISADGKGFLKGLGLWFLLAIPSTYTNSMIRHLQSKLSLQIRSNLTRYIHDLYFSSELRYYRNGLEGIDQYITADVEAWAESLSGLYGNLLKPSLDIILFTSQLSRSLGVRGTILLFSTYYATVSILRAVTPAFGRLAAVEAKLEGEYRAGMARVSKEGEEVAFYDGGGRERDILTRAYMRLIKHVNSIYKIRIAYEWTEDFVIKYLWSAAGYALIAVPFLFTRKKRAAAVQTGTDKPRDAVANRTETYISNRRLLLSLADAGGRLMYAYKDILELAGLTTRLYTLISSLYNLPSRSIAQSSDSFKLQDVGVIIPDADAHVLVKDLSLHLHQGDHLMITGSNGVGKTAVARVLAGLWSSPKAIERPSGKDVYVIPQRAYMVTGSLLSQIIYPDAYPDFVAKGKTLDDLMVILEAVNLAYLPEREGGWETIKEWRDVLSGGEKQRMGMARVFYHLPKYAILDECTSAVSSDVEGRMYEHAKSLGITLITISLRPSLMKYHTHLLTLSGDGNGSWTLARIGTKEERMGIDREIANLESKLEDVEGWKGRLDELNRLLSVQELHED